MHTNYDMGIHKQADSLFLHQLIAICKQRAFTFRQIYMYTSTCMCALLVQMQWRALWAVCNYVHFYRYNNVQCLQYMSSLTQWNVSISDQQLLLSGGVASCKFVQLLPHVAHSINKIGFQVRTHLTKVLIDLCENIIMCISQFLSVLNKQHIHVYSITNAGRTSKSSQLFAATCTS